ncbi:MAG: hypothetical protein U0169_23360 [Polyangiaceae bacterium]
MDGANHPRERRLQDTRERTVARLTESFANVELSTAGLGARARTFAAIAIALTGCKAPRADGDTSTVPAPPVAAPTASHAFATEPPKPVLNDWFALGSGCRAKFDLEGGDVRIEHVPDDAGLPGTHAVRFHMEKFELHATGTPKKLARECAIRLNVNPPPGMRVKDVVARASFVVSKSVAATLKVHGELKLGSVTLGHRTVDLARGVGVREREERMDLRAGQDPTERFPVLGCGEPKIIGFDATWISERDSESDVVDARMGGDRTLAIEAVLEPCS